MLGLTKNSRDYGYDNNNGLGARAVCPTSNGQVAASFGKQLSIPTSSGIGDVPVIESPLSYGKL